MNVVTLNRRHLSTLHVGDPAVGVQNENIHVLALPTSFDRSTPGITRGGAHDDDLLTPSGQYVVEQPPQQLEGEILKSQCGAVKQFKEPLVMIKLQDRGNRLMTKVAV